MITICLGSRRGLLALAMLLVPTAALGAEDAVRLREAFVPGYQYHVSCRVELSGALTLPLEKDQKTASDAITLGKKSDEVLASKERSNEDNLQVQVPSGEKLVVMITSRKQAKVRVKMVGK